MHPSIHPDHAFASRLQDPNSEPFQTSNDRRRGFVGNPKSASIHSISPSNPSNPSPPALAPWSSGSGNHTPDFIHPGGGSSAGNPLFTGSPLQNHVIVDHAQVPIPASVSFGSGDNNANFNFNPSGSGDGLPPQNGWGLNTGLPPPQHATVEEFLPAGDMGFDWMNWMSTANVSMGPVEEQYGIQ
jgi:hypothetical protein